MAIFFTSTQSHRDDDLPIQAEINRIISVNNGKEINSRVKHLPAMFTVIQFRVNSEFANIAYTRYSKGNCCIQVMRYNEDEPIITIHDIASH